MRRTSFLLSWFGQVNFFSLKNTVGEPINAEAWYWYHDVVGEKRCAIVDTWWQTGENTLHEVYRVFHLFQLIVIRFTCEN